MEFPFHLVPTVQISCSLHFGKCIFQICHVTSWWRHQIPVETCSMEFAFSSSTYCPNFMFIAFWEVCFSEMSHDMCFVIRLGVEATIKNTISTSLLQWIIIIIIMIIIIMIIIIIIIIMIIIIIIRNAGTSVCSKTATRLKQCINRVATMNKFWHNEEFL